MLYVIYCLYFGLLDQYRLISLDIDVMTDILLYILHQVLLYNGQLDVIVSGPLTEAYLQKLSWSGQQEYLIANKTIWKVNPSDIEVAGYARTVKDFVQVM